MILRLVAWQLKKRQARWSNPTAPWRMARAMWSIKDRLWDKRISSKRLRRRSRLRPRFD